MSLVRAKTVVRAPLLRTLLETLEVIGIPALEQSTFQTLHDHSSLVIDGRARRRSKPEMCPMKMMKCSLSQPAVRALASMADRQSASAPSLVCMKATYPMKPPWQCQVWKRANPLSDLVSMPRGAIDRKLRHLSGTRKLAPCTLVSRPTVLVSGEEVGEEHRHRPPRLVLQSEAVSVEVRIIAVAEAALLGRQAISRMKSRYSLP